MNQDFSSEDEYEENEEDMLSILCLFCDEKRPKFEEIFAHIKNEHEVDFVESCKNAQLDLYGFYKVVNYIRGNSTKAQQFGDVLKENKFSSDAFLTPALPDDDFLMFGGFFVCLFCFIQTFL